MEKIRKPNFELRKVTSKLVKTLTENSVVVLALTLLVLGFITLQRINTKTHPEVDQKHLTEKVLELQKVEFDQTAVEQIKKLNSTSIEITSKFTDRNNPFEDN